jgi:hypothetical protein
VLVRNDIRPSKKGPKICANLTFYLYDVISKE